MFPALMAAQPLVKYGVMIGVPVLILATSHTTLYFKGKAEGKREVRAEWDAALVTQVEETNQQILDTRKMETDLQQAIAQRDQIIGEQAVQLTRKALHHAKSKPASPLSPQFVRMYDELSQLSNQAGHRLPAADSGSGTLEVPRGEVHPSASQLLQVEGANGEPIELTTDELYQAVLDAHEKLRDAKNDFSDFSAWNDGREAIELKRLTDE